MKIYILGILLVFAIIICGASQTLPDGIGKYKASEAPPASFSSEKELKEHLMVDDWHDYKTGEKEFFVCVSELASSAMPNEMVTCWYVVPKTKELIRVWDIHLVNAGPIRFEFDKKTTRLSIIAIGNTEFTGQAVASVVLSVL